MGYFVRSIYRTIQGVGVWAGRPTTLVLFQGCNLACWYCDKKDARFKNVGVELDRGILLDKIKEIAKPDDIILFSGGEPCIQDVSPLAAEFDTNPVHLETNGTMPCDFGAFDWVTVSPKMIQQPTRRAMAAAEEFVFVVTKPEDEKWILLFFERNNDCIPRGTEITVCPVWRGDPDGSGGVSPVMWKCTVDMAMRHGWRFSAQLNKYAGTELE